jgi:hypothetical protein
MALVVGNKFKKFYYKEVTGTVITISISIH